MSVLMQSILSVHILLHLRIYYILKQRKRKKNKRVANEKRNWIMLLMTMLIRRRLSVRKPRKKKMGGCICEGTSTSNTQLLLRM